MNPLGPVDLLIIQGSPFCNIDCKYCYLPDRDTVSKISLETVLKIFERLIEANLIKKDFTVVWHAGEPMAVKMKYYQEIFNVIDKITPSNVNISHSFQTNGTLITEEWCEFIKTYNIRLGLSIDGPKFIHDKYRLKRNGNGTHDDIIKGIKLLRKHNIDFHAISVISDFSLDYPNEIFDFFLQMEISRVGFNIEEIEWINNSSTINYASSERVLYFLKETFKLQKENEGKIIIREFESAFRKIIGNPISPFNSLEDTLPKSHLLNAYGIISIDSNGNFTTFSPELLGQKSKDYDNFILGNVHKNSFQDALQTDLFERINIDIQKGINLCEKTCSYFNICGGGAPSNKYYENGTFSSTETMYCKYTIKFPIDLILNDLENVYHV